MQVVEFPEFVVRTRSGWRRSVDMSRIADMEYACACGESHVIAAGTRAIRELAGKRFVLVCPHERGLTCVSVTGILRPTVTSLFGTPLEPDEDGEGPGEGPEGTMPAGT